MAPTRILILSDGRPGHFNLSEGIAAALERLGPSTTERIDIRRGRWPGAVLAGMTRARLPAARMLAMVYGLRAATAPPADVIVSAGAETLAASIWLARLIGVPNIFYGSLRHFSPHDFKLVLTSYAENAGRPNHVMTLKPSKIDPGQLDLRGSGAFPNVPTLGLLLGGDSGDVTYQPAEWHALLELVRHGHRHNQLKWLVANSRRTPAAVSDAFAAEAASGTPAIAEFLDVRTAGPGTLSPLLARCDAVLCTADSSSMISECVWTRRRNLSLAPDAIRLPNNEAGYRAWLCQSGWTGELPIREATPTRVLELLSGITPMTTNPQHDLAMLLKSRLPNAMLKRSNPE